MTISTQSAAPYCRRGCHALGAVVLGCLLLLGPAGPMDAQQGKFVTQATTRLVKLINASNQQGYELQDNSFSIGGGWLQQGENNWVPLFSMDLQANRRYRFLAAGDFDAHDVDLQVVDLNSRVLAKDESTEADAIVNFTPTYTGRYIVRIRLYASRQNLPAVCLAIVMSAR